MDEQELTVEGRLFLLSSRWLALSNRVGELRGSVKDTREIEEMKDTITLIAKATDRLEEVVLSVAMEDSDCPF